MVITWIMFTLKILTALCIIKQNLENKHFCRYYLQYFSSKRILIKHREVYLNVKGKQSLTVDWFY